MARYVTYGVSPRASIYMVAAAQALALVRGRKYVLPEDVRTIAPDVLRHRLVLSYEALGDDVDADDIVDGHPGEGPDARGRAARHRARIGLPRHNHLRRQRAIVETTADLTPERVLRRLEWQVIRRLDGRLQGDYRTLLRGHGTDFRDLRDYEWGDDVRHIDWNVTARMDELFVREFMEDRELTAWLLLDRSPSMAFGAVERTKERLLCELAATLGQLFVRGGNRIGAIIYDGDRLWTIPPRQGRNQVLALVRELLRPLTGGSVTDLEQAARPRRPTGAPPRRSSW